MNGPSEELRSEIRSQIDEITGTPPNALRSVTPQSEDRLTGVLTRITDALQLDAVGEGDEPGNLLDATNEWAGLLSYAVGRIYAPASPWPFGLGGWGRGPVRALQRGAELLQIPLAQAATALRANGFSVSVGFPWGVSVGLSWPIPLIAPENNATTSAQSRPGNPTALARKRQRLLDRAMKINKWLLPSLRGE